MSNTATLSVPSDEQIDKLYDAFQKYLEARLNEANTKLPPPETFSKTPKKRWNSLLPSYEDEHTSIKVASRGYYYFKVDSSWNRPPILGCFYDITCKRSGLTFMLYSHYNAMNGQKEPSWHLRFNDHPACVVTWKEIVDGYEAVKDWVLITKLAKP